MRILLNPVIANFDVLFFGKKGFSSLARAKIIKYRPKGRKDLPWLILDVSKLRKKVDKQLVLFQALEKYRLELEKKNRTATKKLEKEEKQRIKTLKRSEKIEGKDTIKFKLIKQKDNIVTSKENKIVRYRTLTYELHKLLQFVKGTGSPNSLQVEQYLLAVGTQFKKDFKKYGKARYYLRITHRYRALKSSKQNDPKNKKFDGFSSPRFTADKLSDIDAAIRYLIESYIPKFQKYLKFATSQTSFDFLGFTLEVTLPNIK